jgi:sensor histidine kinase YesM
VKEKRKKIWIDRFQTQLFLRTTMYFLVYQACVWAMVSIERSLHPGLLRTLGPEPASFVFLFLVAIALFIGFLFTWDAIHHAHRIVGPLYRFRKTIQAIKNGEEVELIVLRKGDMLLEMRDDFNEMLKALESRGAIIIKSSEAKTSTNQPVPA